MARNLAWLRDLSDSKVVRDRQISKIESKSKSNIYPYKCDDAQGLFREIILLFEE